MLEVFTIYRNMEEFQKLVNECNTGVICLSEAWLKPNIQSMLKLIPLRIPLVRGSIPSTTTSFSFNPFCKNNPCQYICIITLRSNALSQIVIAVKHNILNAFDLILVTKSTQVLPDVQLCCHQQNNLGLLKSNGLDESSSVHQQNRFLGNSSQL